jgi:hypothetical protein
MTPVQTYDEMSDAEIIAFVADRLPSLEWRVDKKPRCFICREAILKELAARPLFEPLEGRPAHA